MLKIHRLAGLAGSRNTVLYIVHAMQLVRVQGSKHPVHGPVQSPGFVSSQFFEILSCS